MITEPEVVDAICGYLQGKGFEIEQRVVGTLKGVDVIARRASVRLHIEAKGETSANSNSKRFGTIFDSAQVRVHVAEAFYKAAESLSEPKTDIELLAALALPRERNHERGVSRIKPILDKLRIGVFWVEQDRTITLEAPWSI